ncbi:hypothetical protein QBZ16_001654 [Prototheca wickerhamii]|uniref:Uncharacterized protein n=1 Tax=Prototheca wickerhamii TaxID=3111 RepID=A0AAD9ICZ1_PROWI|nr:hypothetical protein QBZ16_001654 [Prototheca wickerhamii]
MGLRKAPKPVASCAFPAGPGMKIKTTTPLVKKAREGVMEFLLINHPLDCPICDQGGECDLQDQAMSFGSDRGRYTEAKRSVVDKNLGPLVKTVMTRCIHCTRCVRFAKEVAGIEDLGVTGRGSASEIGTYVERAMTSELSGNVIDLCPVGALTAKPSAFTYRSWELATTESVDVSDAMGAAIRVDARGPEVFRVTPRLNDAINQEWISDKARFQIDALKLQRLAQPLVRGADGQLAPATWPEALARVAEALRGASPDAIQAVAGKLADAEAIIALKDLLNRLGSGNTVAEGSLKSGGLAGADFRAGYSFNTTFAGVDEADAVLLIGTNPRVEAPVLNARLRALAVAGVPFGSVYGGELDLTYPVRDLGADLEAALADAKVIKALKEAKRPLVIVGAGVLARPDAAAALARVAAFAAKAELVRVEGEGGDSDASSSSWNGLAFLGDDAGTQAALDLGFVPSASASTNPSVVYLLGADDYEVPASAEFVVYQGSHGERGAARADVVLPGAAYTEKFGTYVNAEGRAQATKRAVAPPAQARDDWKIVRALSEVVGESLPYDSLSGVRARLAEVAPHLARRGALEQPIWLPGAVLEAAAAGAKGALDAAVPLVSSVANFYQTDAVSRTSKTMAKCVKARQNPIPGLDDLAAESG